MDSNQLKRRLEWIWWGFTLLVVIVVLLPIALQTTAYPFYVENAAYIVIFITFARYTFFLRHTFIAKMLWPKLLIIAAGTITVFIIIMSLGDFTNYLEEVGLQTLVAHQPVSTQYSLMRYIQGEMLFFGIASAVSAVVLPLRMVISIFRMYNHGTV